MRNVGNGRQLEGVLPRGNVCPGGWEVSAQVSARGCVCPGRCLPDAPSPWTNDSLVQTSPFRNYVADKIITTLDDHNIAYMINIMNAGVHDKYHECCERASLLV